MDIYISDLYNSLAESKKLLVKGDIENAVNFSGQTLAAVDAAWSKMFNARTLDSDTDKLLAEAGICHCKALICGGMENMAFSTSCTVLFQLTVAGKYSEVPVILRIELLLIAFTWISEFMQKRNPEKYAPVREHVSHIACYLYSMLYVSYLECSTESDVDILHSAYMTLKSVEGLIPLIKDGDEVCGRKVSLSDPYEIFVDLIGRAKASGFFDD